MDGNALGVDDGITDISSDPVNGAKLGLIGFVFYESFALPSINNSLA